MTMSYSKLLITSLLVLIIIIISIYAFTYQPEVVSDGDALDELMGDHDDLTGEFSEGTDEDVSLQLPEAGLNTRNDNIAEGNVTETPTTTANDNVPTGRATLTPLPPTATATPTATPAPGSPNVNGTGLPTTGNTSGNSGARVGRSHTCTDCDEEEDEDDDDDTCCSDEDDCCGEEECEDDCCSCGDSNCAGTAAEGGDRALPRLRRPGLHRVEGDPDVVKALRDAQDGVLRGTSHKHLPSNDCTGCTGDECCEECLATLYDDCAVCFYEDHDNQPKPTDIAPKILHPYLNLSSTRSSTRGYRSTFLSSRRGGLSICLPSDSLRSSSVFVYPEERDIVNGPQVEPVADLREAKGEINRRASTASGKDGPQVES